MLTTLFQFPLIKEITIFDCFLSGTSVLGEINLKSTFLVMLTTLFQFLLIKEITIFDCFLSGTSVLGEINLKSNWNHFQLRSWPLTYYLNLPLRVKQRGHYPRQKVSPLKLAPLREYIKRKRTHYQDPILLIKKLKRPNCGSALDVRIFSSKGSEINWIIFVVSMAL